MASKPKPNGCGICREIQEAAEMRGQSLIEFFTEAHKKSSVERDWDTSEKIIINRVLRFEEFCDKHVGPYEVPKCVVDHVRSTMVQPTKQGQYKRRRDDFVRPSRASQR